MKQTKEKKRWKYLIILLLILIAVITAGIIMKHKLSEKEHKDEISYQVTSKELKFGDNIYSLYVHGSDMYYVKSDGTQDEKKSIYTYNLDSQENQKLPYKLNGFNNLCDMCQDAKGNYYALVYGYDLPACDSVMRLSKYYESVSQGKTVHYNPFSKGITETFEIIKLDKTGKEVGRVRLFELFTESDEFTDYSVNFINVDKSGNVYVVDSTKKITVFDSKLKQLFELMGKNYSYYDLFRLGDGAVGIRTLTDGGKYQIATIDVKKKGFGKVYKKIDGLGNRTVLSEGENNQLLYEAGGEIKVYSLSKQSVTSTGVEFARLQVSPEYIKCIRQLEDGSYQTVHLTYDNSGKSVITLLNIMEDNGNDERTKLTLATFQMNDSTQQLIMEFNQRNEGCILVEKDYSQYSKEERMTHFQRDMLEGKIDLVDGSACDWRNFASQGMFEDLYTYIDSDKEMNRKDFYENVLNSCSLKKKLYTITPGFEVKTLIGRISDVGKEQKWTFEQYRKVKERLTKDQVMIYGRTRSEVLTDMVSSNLSSLVDYETCQSHFDSPVMKDILEFSAQMKSEEELKKERQSDTALDDFIRKMKKGQIRLNYVNLSPLEVQSLKVYQKLMGEEVNMAGYPGVSGNVIKTDHLFAIAKNSKEKELAWSFIRQQLTQDYQNQFVDKFPIRKASCESILEGLTKEVIVSVDETGKPLKDIAGEWNYGNYKDTLKPVSKQVVNQCKEVLGNTKALDESNEEILSIVLEEASAYFAGSRNFQEVSAIMKNRVDTYLSETFQ